MGMVYLETYIHLIDLYGKCGPVHMPYIDTLILYNFEFDPRGGWNPVRKNHRELKQKNTHKPIEMTQITKTAVMDNLKKQNPLNRISFEILFKLRIMGSQVTGGLEIPNLCYTHPKASFLQGSVILRVEIL